LIFVLIAKTADNTEILDFFLDGKKIIKIEDFIV